MIYGVLSLHTRVGHMLLRGILPGATALRCVGVLAKSFISPLSRRPVPAHEPRTPEQAQGLCGRDNVAPLINEREVGGASCVIPSHGRAGREGTGVEQTTGDDPCHSPGFVEECCQRHGGAVAGSAIY